ncbi:RND transporter [Corynebacterium phocae]|uniref:RND transporter n=1 Tax=Corynebacterium phocae TaxID=161895 RepID=A0A1L7D5N8_9CORY|nr:MMPL family transporter [Corynebacterium phocae]APT93387.1 RND transporter [Corynebacterium phocae]KAA8721729.1 MMPL family transporter [Corynebacterium phocae]
MFYSWGKFSYAHRKLIPLVIIAGILALFGIFGTHLDQRMSQEGWDDPASASTAAARIEQETFGRDNRGDVIVLIEDPKANFDAAKAYLDAIKSGHPDQVDYITSYFDTPNPNLISQDGTVAFAAIGLKGDSEQTLKDYHAIEPALYDTELPVQIAGATAVADALDDGMANDVARAEKLALPLVGLLLLFVFGSVVAAFMPLIVGGLSILGSLGILAILAQFLQVNTFAHAVVTLLGLGLAIDYGLFMVSRFREELDKGKDPQTAVAVTTATAGQTVVFSAASVAVALSGLFIFPQAFLKSVAYGAISAVGLAALLSVTVLPALFGLLGTNIDRLAVRRTKRTARRIEDTWWYKLPQWTFRRATLVTGAVTALLVGLTLPMLAVSFGGINETYLPPNQEVRVAQDRFNETFPAFRTEPVKLVVDGASNQQLVDIYLQVRGIEGLTEPMSPSSPTKDGTTVLSAGIVDREDYSRIVHELKSVEAPAGVGLYVGGTPALEVESLDALFAKLPWMSLYMVVATFILMALVFGSLILPAKAIIMTLLTAGATLGILSAMFVLGVGSGLLNYSAGPLMSPVLVLIIAIIYGLSTDYEVFLVSRMVEAREKGASTDEAIARGTAQTGGIITAAALIMIVVAGAFGFSDIVMMKYIAFGMIFALAIDATVVRMLLVPAVMHLLREDNWWAPGFIKAAYEKLGHGKEPVLVAPDFESRRAGDPQAHEPVQPEAVQPVARAQVSKQPEVVQPEAKQPSEGTGRGRVARGKPTSSAGGDHSLREGQVPFSELLKRIESQREQ